MTAQRKVFLLCSRRPIIAEFCLLAETLTGSREFKPVLVVPDGLLNMLPRPLPDGSEAIAMGARSWRAAGVAAFIAYIGFAVLRRLSKLARTCDARLAADFLDTWEALTRGKSFGRRVLRINGSTAAVLTADDRDIRIDQGVLLEARRNGIFTLACAFGKSDAATDALRRASSDFDADSAPWLKWKAKIERSYPAGIRTDRNGRRVLFFRPGDFLALRAHGALFAAPWSYGGGTADKVSVIDREASATARDLGVPENKLLVAGQCSHDVLWAMRERRPAIRTELAAKHGIDAGRPLVILALPVLGEHGMSSAEQQREEAHWLFQTLGEAAAGNVLVSLHPRQEKSRYEAIANECGVKLADSPLRDVLAAADLFVAYSSTISWAQLLGIPTIALEYHALGYLLFDAQPGVDVITQREALAEACASALNGPRRTALLSELAAFRDNVPFDGKVRERLLNEIKTSSAKGISCASSD
jgi:hypothetical protein